MYSVTEKRKYKRIELTENEDKKIVPPYITRFRVKQYEGQEISSPDWDIVAVKNLSAGGMVYAYNKGYNKNLELDSLLDLKIDFFKSIPSINCIGRVVRIEEPMPMTNSMSRITAKFTEIDEQEREMINTTVEAILRKEAKMKNAMARKVTMAESKQENSTTLQTINTTKKTVEEKSLPERATKSIGIKKRFLKTKNVCKVTFRLPKVAAPDAKSVSIVGDFNNWNTHANPMKKLKDGDYSIQLDLEPGREYQFRCLIDELKWENNRNADKYVRSVYGNCDNSVVKVRCGLVWGRVKFLFQIGYYKILFHSA
jgi:hypothetical protein